MIRIFALVSLTALIAGCGGTAPEPGASPSATAPTVDGTELTIRVSDGKTSRTASLTCDPTGGTHANAAEACKFLAAGAEQGADPFAPVPGDRACAEVYGGPDTATVIGVWNGQKIDATFSRTDACQSARWDQAAPLLTLR